MWRRRAPEENMRIPSNSVLACFAAVSGLACIPDAGAATTWGYAASSGGDCQLSIPTLDTKFRPKGSGARNESSTTSYFVICPTQGFSNSLDALTQVVAAFSFTPPPGVPGATINCTAGSGTTVGNDIRYSSKSTTIPGNGAISWTGDDFGNVMGNPIPGSLVFSVTCNLPPGSAIVSVESIFAYDLGQ
jgi:hypothetical protein